MRKAMRNGIIRLLSAITLATMAGCGGSGSATGSVSPPPPPPPPPGGGTGSATLSWTPPTQYDDGSPLMNLAGYRFYWGTIPGIYPSSVTINNPGISVYVIDNLVPGDYEFVATAFTVAGAESGFSNPVSKTVP